MGEEEVILTRDRKGKIHVFLNTCRHRGMKVCRYDDGNALVFTCPFHAWTYDTDGRLVGVPHHRDAYFEELDKSQWGLAEVAQMCNYYGSIWATWDPKAPSFEDYLGPSSGRFAGPSRHPTAPTRASSSTSPRNVGASPQIGSSAPSALPATAPTPP